MNTEPPEGDDLQRMLVSMKQNVLERATPRAARRRGRSGIVIGVVALLAVGTATGAVALTLSQQDTPVAAPTQTQVPEPSPTATTPSSAPITGAPTPTSTPTQPSPKATIPTECRALVPAADYDRFFGDIPVMRVEPPEEGLPPEYTAAPGSESDVDTETAPTVLYCLWKDPHADITGIAITAGTGTPEQIEHAERDFYQGWSPTCDDVDGSRTCSQTKQDPQYGTDWARTMYVRGGTWVQIDQVNVPTDGLLPAIVAEIWGD